MELKNVILEQNPHWQKRIVPEQYVQRDLLANFKLKSAFIEVVVGVRRSGKSTILRLLADEIITKKMATPREILFANFDNPGFLPYYDHSEKLDELIEQAEALNGEKIKYLFLDEVQNISFWEKWVKAKYDQKIFRKIFITGSNANLLTGQYISRLSGRYFAHTNYPYSFKEYLTAQKTPFYKTETDNFPLKHKHMAAFQSFLRGGGFPEVVRSGDAEIIDSYYQTVILKDVADMRGVRDSLSLKQLAYYLVSNATQLISYNGIAKQLGIHENTAKEYLSYFQDAYLFYELKKFDYSLKKQMANKRKIYIVDNAFVDRVGLDFSDNSGKFLENLVFMELLKAGQEIYYHGGANECDFVIRKNNRIETAIQVCYDLNEKNRKREIAGAEEAMEVYNLKKSYILTSSQEELIPNNGRKIIVMPIWKWLLGI